MPAHIVFDRRVAGDDEERFRLLADEDRVRAFRQALLHAIGVVGRDQALLHPRRGAAHVREPAGPGDGFGRARCAEREASQHDYDRSRKDTHVALDGTRGQRLAAVGGLTTMTPMRAVFWSGFSLG